MSKRLVCLLAAAIVAGSAPDDARAQGYGAIPSYYQSLDFNLTSPSAFTEAVGGFANPSIYPMMPGGEFEFYWSTFDEAFHDPKRWGIFTGLENLGFGANYAKLRLPTGDVSITDYRIAVGGGTKRSTFGLGYGWSGGDEGTFGRDDLIQAGLTLRPNSLLSLSGSFNFSADSGKNQQLVDAAIRPLGNDKVTIFGDVEFSSNDLSSATPWSVGAMLEVPAGLKIVGRWFEGDGAFEDAFSVGLAYTLGPHYQQGVIRGSAVPRFDDDSNHTLTNWGLRAGYPERSDLMKPLAEDRGYYQMSLKGSAPYTTFRYFDTRTPLAQILKSIDDAREDYRVAGVAINLSGAKLSRGAAWEIRERLGELRATGKHVVVFVDEFGMSTYYLASVADRIVMDPEGYAILPGYAIGRTYIANMIEKIGLGIEEWRFLKYKSAMESLVRHEMSESDREQRQALVDQFYATFRDDVAQGRRVDAKTVDRWIDEVTLFTAQQALDEKLVDELGRWEEVTEAAKVLEGGKQPFVNRSALANEWYPSKAWGERPQIAVVYAIGPCAMDSGIQARKLENILRRLRDDRDTKAIVLRVDSPGGSPVASDVVANQLRRCMEKKPVVISQGDVAASGGYWLSMVSNQIVAQPTTITGSIGVISGWVWDKGVGEKLGMEGDFVEAGEHADLFFSLRPPFLPVAIPHRTVTDEERERAINGMKSMYSSFVRAVAKNRSMTNERVEELAQGRVWTGVEAKNNGLVDRIGGLHAAIQVARELAEIGPRDEVKVVEYGGKRGLFRLPFETPSLFSPWSAIASVATFGAYQSLVARELLAESAEESDKSVPDDYDLVYLQQIIRNNGRGLCLLPPDYLPREGDR
ncbi:MAG: signal peptide peptidase SppA [Candidatus Latescibacteria bacterium]|nr:signal peptide peptidase SppA [Candidatus Latescibacterota bacterium]